MEEEPVCSENSRSNLWSRELGCSVSRSQTSPIQALGRHPPSLLWAGIPRPGGLKGTLRVWPECTGQRWLDSRARLPGPPVWMARRGPGVFRPGCSTQSPGPWCFTAPALGCPLPPSNASSPWFRNRNAERSPPLREDGRQLCGPRWLSLHSQSSFALHSLLHTCRCWRWCEEDTS